MALLTILAAAVAGAAILATADTEDTENSVQVEKLGDSLNDNAFAVVNFGKTGIAGIQAPKPPERNTGYVPKTQLAQVPFQTVSIPQNFAGLEAVDIPTRLADQFFEHAMSGIKTCGITPYGNQKQTTHIHVLKSAAM